ALMDDGVHIDPYNKVATPMIVYPSKRQKSFWMHSDGEMVHAHSRLSDEGVDNLDNINSDLRLKKFVLAECSPDINREEAAWTNTMFISPGRYPGEPRVRAISRHKRAFPVSFRFGRLLHRFRASNIVCNSGEKQKG